MKRLPMMQNILDQPASHERVLALHAQSLSSVKECAAMLRDATGRIVFSGMGASLFAVLPAVSYLEERGYFVQAVESSELLHYGARTLRARDVGVLVSRSGGSIEVLRLAEKMRGLGMAIVAVTNVPDSPLERIADATLHIGSQPDQLIAVQTYTGTVLKMLLLAEEVHTRSSDHVGDACLAALPALRKTIDECFDRSGGWRMLLDQPGPLYLLGRGPALAAAQEGSLLFHETAKTAAVAMSAGQFRHGPVEAVSVNFRAIVFGSPARTRDLDRALRDDLTNMGATAIWIGPEPKVSQGSTDEHALMAWPSIDPLVAPILEIVPMQVAVYCLALWRDIVPGDFRYASEVTATEAGFPASQSQAVKVQARDSSRSLDAGSSSLFN